jgi:hypothetical protein
VKDVIASLVTIQYNQTGKCENGIFIRKRKKYQKLIFTQPNRRLIEGLFRRIFFIEVGNKTSKLIVLGDLFMYQ